MMVETLELYHLGLRVLGLPPDSTEWNSAQLTDAFNFSLVLRAAFVYGVNIMTAAIEDIPNTTEQAILRELAREYDCKNEDPVRLATLMAAIPESPLARFCRANGLAVDSERAPTLFIADGFPITGTDLASSQPLLAWLRKHGVTTLGQLAAKSEHLSSQSGWARYRVRIKRFLAECEWTQTG